MAEGNQKGEAAAAGGGEAAAAAEDDGRHHGDEEDLYSEGGSSSSNSRGLAVQQATPPLPAACLVDFLPKLHLSLYLQLFHAEMVYMR